MKGILNDVISKDTITFLNNICLEDMYVNINVVKSSNIDSPHKINAFLLAFNYNLTLNKIVTIITNDKKDKSVVYKWIKDVFYVIKKPNSNTKLYNEYIKALDTIQEHTELYKNLNITQDDKFDLFIHEKANDSFLLLASIELYKGTPILQICNTYYVTKTDLLNYYNNLRKLYANTD